MMKRARSWEGRRKKLKEAGYMPSGKAGAEGEAAASASGSGWASGAEVAGVDCSGAASEALSA
jgi:hypothetical protein